MNLVNTTFCRLRPTYLILTFLERETERFEVVHEKTKAAQIEASLPSEPELAVIWTFLLLPLLHLSSAPLYGAHSLHFLA